MNNKINFPKHILKLSTSVLLFLSFFVVNDAFSTHIVGGNITYRHLGGENYQVSLTLRRDCFLGSSEAEFDDPASIGIFTASGALATWLGNNGQIRIPLMTNDTLNPFIISDCGFEGTQVCVQEATYTGTIRLPLRPGGYILSYQRCCRNATLSNILNPLETGTTYWIAVTENAMNIGNATPKFKQWPDVYICANRPLVFDHSAEDLDGDSLVYKLCVPNSGATRINPKPQPPNFPPYNLVQFASPYSLNDMMGGVPLTIDPQTGIITTTPNLVGQFLIGVCVEEYRNGVLISTVRRDFQYNVRVCSQPPKAFFETSETDCTSLDVTFINNSLAASNFVWYFDYPNTDPAFVSTEANPSFSYPTSGIYNVKLRATRGSDGCFDSIIKPVSVFINNIEPDFLLMMEECDPEAEMLTLALRDQSIYNQPGFVIDNWIWKVTQNGITIEYSGEEVFVPVAYTGEITVELSLGTTSGCTKKLTKTIDPADLLPESDFSVTLEDCSDGTTARLLLKDNSVVLNPLATIDEVRWIINQDTFYGFEVIVDIPTTTTNFSVSHKLSFFSDCEVETTKNYNLQQLLPKSKYIFEALGCDDDNSVNVKFTYSNENALGFAPTSIKWNVGIISNIQAFTSNEVLITIPKDSLIYVTLSVVFENGCEDEINESFIPGPFALIKFSGDPIILCPNQIKPIITNGNADWDYIWSPETGLDLTNPAQPLVIAGENQIYHVTVTDGLCTVFGSVEVIVLSGGVTLSVDGNENTCDGTVELIVTGGVGQGDYTWSTDLGGMNVVGAGDTLRTNFTGDSQNYYVQFAGESCSTMPTLFTVTNQTPDIFFASPFKVCPGDNVIVPVFNENNQHNVTYTWVADPRITGSLTTNTVNVTVGEDETENFTLYFTVDNQFGCSYSDSIIFELQENPLIDFNYVLDECGEFKICFELVGTHNGLVKWDFGVPGSSSLEEAPCFTYTDAGIYNVKLENLVATCPFVPVEKEVIVNPQIMLEPTPIQLVCESETVVLTAQTNLEDVTYVWCTLNGTVIGNEKDFSFVFLQDTSIIIKVQDIYGCTVSDTLEVKFFRFDFNLIIPEISCEGDETNVNVEIDNPELYTFEWLPADLILTGANSTSPRFQIFRDKVYTLRLTNLETNCTEVRTFEFNVNPPLIANFDSQNVFCYQVQGPITLIIDSPDDYNYLWLPEDCIVSGGNTPNPIFRFNEVKTVTVIVEHKITKCLDTFNFTPQVNPPFLIEVNADPDLSIFEGEDVEIFVVDPIVGGTYVWSTGENGESIVVSPVETTTYTVTVTDTNGCVAIDQVIVEVRTAKCDESDIFVPNAFSPNGDDANPIFYVRSNFIDELEMIIYNRWGQEVFRSNDINIGWDGTFAGKELSPDVYAYYINVLCINGMRYKKSGNVSLMR